MMWVFNLGVTSCILPLISDTLVKHSLGYLQHPTQTEFQTTLSWHRHTLWKEHVWRLDTSSVFCCTKKHIMHYKTRNVVKTLVLETSHNLVNFWSWYFLLTSLAANHWSKKFKLNSPLRFCVTICPGQWEILFQEPVLNNDDCQFTVT